MLARAVPEMPCSVLLELDEWPALYCAIHHGPTPPEEPPSLEQAVRWIAQLGGFVGRRRRDQPGTETLWRGVLHLKELPKKYPLIKPDTAILTQPPPKKKKFHNRRKIIFFPFIFGKLRK